MITRRRFAGFAALSVFGSAAPAHRDERVRALHRARPGDPRDTTSPRAMVDALRRVVPGDVLSAASRDVMQRWLRANTTGDHRHGRPADRLDDRRQDGHERHRHDP